MSQLLRQEIDRQKAIITDLANVLEDEFYNQDNHSRLSAHIAVQKIIDEASERFKKSNG